jgi:hypothetical protein
MPSLRFSFCTPHMHLMSHGPCLILKFHHMIDIHNRRYALSLVGTCAVRPRNLWRHSARSKAALVLAYFSPCSRLCCSLVMSDESSDLIHMKQAHAFQQYVRMCAHNAAHVLCQRRWSSKSAWSASTAAIWMIWTRSLSSRAVSQRQFQRPSEANGCHTSQHAQMLQ